MLENIPFHRIKRYLPVNIAMVSLSLVSIFIKQYNINEKSILFLFVKIFFNNYRINDFYAFSGENTVYSVTKPKNSSLI